MENSKGLKLILEALGYRSLSRGILLMKKWTLAQ